jgi:hypothetical protein
MFRTWLGYRLNHCSVIKFPWLSLISFCLYNKNKRFRMTYLFYDPSSICAVDTRSSLPGVKRLGREIDQSPSFSAQFKNAWSYTSNPPYVFMSWCLIMQGYVFVAWYLVKVRDNLYGMWLWSLIGLNWLRVGYSDKKFPQEEGISVASFLVAASCRNTPCNSQMSADVLI